MRNTRVLAAVVLATALGAATVGGRAEGTPFDGRYRAVGVTATMPLGYIDAFEG